MLNSMKDFKSAIIDLIQNEITNIKGMDLFVVTGVNDDLTLNIKQMNRKKQYDNVEMVSSGLGNGTGLIVVPAINSIVLTGFIMNSERPVVIGTLFDTYSNQKDSRLPLSSGEAIILPKLNGAYLYINKNNEIILKEPNGETVTLNSNGLKSTNYNSSDGSQGITQTVQVRDAAGTGTNTITIKNGLIVGFI